MTSTISEPTAGRDPRETQTGRQPKLSRKLIARQRAAERPRVPIPSMPLLNRHRLTNLIQRATASRVTVVCGPTGAGKTVACATWAADPDGHAAPHVAWVSLDPSDRQPATMWADVTMALANTPGAREVLKELPDPGDVTFPLRLAESAERLGTPTTLVMDDVQELAGSDSIASLDLLVRHGPANLRLLIAGRHLAGLGVARLRVGGELAEISSADLACTAEEARAYLAMNGIDLPSDQLEELLGRTEGWITGLRLAALRARSDGEPAAPWRISGDEPRVADYLRDEVLATQTSDRRGFLLRTCVADRICGDLADALTEESGGTAILDQLCRENVLIRRSAQDRGVAQEAAPGGVEYQYHPLLLDLLRAQLRRELPAELPLLAQRAARWQAAHGDYAEALKNAAWAGDWDFAGDVLAKSGPQLLLPGPAAVLEPILASFPAGRYASDAPVAGALAAAGLRTGDIAATQLHLDNANAAIGRCPPEQQALVSTWLQALQLMHATSRAKPDVEVAEESAAAAARAATAICGDTEHQALGLLWSAIGVAALSRTRIADARDALFQACRHLHGHGPDEFMAQANGWRAVAEAMYGDLLAADGLVSELIKQPERAADPVSARLADLASAYLCLAKDETASARRLLDQCDSDGATSGWASTVATSLVTVARARLALCDGDQSAARRLVTRLRYQGLNTAAWMRRTADGAHPTGRTPTTSGAEGGASAPIDSALAMLDADIALGEGNVAGARLAISRADHDTERGRADLLLGSARVLLAEGDSKAALAKAETCLTGTAAQVTLRDQISALVTAAVARRRLGQPEQAADQLGYALALAEPHGLYRPFLDGGQAARSALTVLIRPANQGAATAARILQRFDTRPGRLADSPATVPLTCSELAVLRFLPSHMTNQEIAESLFLSINTVKTHLRSVYRKLGVTTRRQAISAAGRLGLL
jgi:LuxR family transcriptional regulator, maltose regulon positive regulatory protein